MKILSTRKFINKIKNNVKKIDDVLKMRWFLNENIKLFTKIIKIKMRLKSNKTFFKNVTKVIAESSFEQKKMFDSTLETDSYNKTRSKIEQCSNVLILRLFEKID